MLLLLLVRVIVSVVFNAGLFVAALLCGDSQVLCDKFVPQSAYLTLCGQTMTIFHVLKVVRCTDPFRHNIQTHRCYLLPFNVYCI